ncbi:alpha/beta hydrolase [Listeria welshimeri]|uniref:Hydrolase, alpha/beta fold family n=1 Tax=Listeria welshimeri serovar 6b (strain ATCC 35897 / DSM 20650 / CCUG 15529 / CIP 8149 / NCTC 11857 / SLCC 5334 / V8) TaxID=386043 RepID=A0AI63_LISW6|nr:alpha/beta hydrolase [Listeria welshimeri]MBC1692278.1 alpha/beta hydrolase [Listeria welshimeri]MBC1958301.1 alpha/beta hydrolase [Listeria welshimeri]MBC2351076.1 alpha/beta hydrolase [Listeria welshimeri]MBF2463206.1 alpha/beta hydrolase [Listeria welshimeri]MBF2612707.1 alpha/beta hydrolase [Listeria welshimeri]
MNKEMKLKAADGLELHLHIWDEVEKPIGLIQIVHGMAEHGARYDLFAKRLNQAGYIVVADDHRGFGKSAINESYLGHLDGETGFQNMIQDEVSVRTYIKENYPNLPYFIFAHSMGSFIIRTFMAQHQVDGVILSGSGLQPTALLKMGQIITKYRVKKDDKKRSGFLNKLAFWGYNKPFNENHRFSWLSRDVAVYEAYEKDPFCGPVVGTSGFFHNLFEVVKVSQQKETLESVPKDLPILLLSGSDDPVGHFGKDTPKIALALEKAGVEDVTYKIYENARHELVNELCKETVFQDVIDWLNAKTR